MSERKGLSHLDWIALALFGLGIFGAVLLLAAGRSTEPLESLGGTARFAALWAALLGIWPSFAWHAGLAVLGTRLFLTGKADRLARNLLGWTGMAVALAILFGAFGDPWGGAVGHHTGVVLRDTVHVAVALFVGAVALFAVAWFAWLRDANEIAPDLVTSLAHPEAAPARAPRAVTAVTAAESAALFPSREEAAPGKHAGTRVLERVLEVASEGVGEVRKIVTPAPAPSVAHPYPEDVRLKGQIPSGAKPLTSGSGSGSGAGAMPVAGLGHHSAANPGADATAGSPTVRHWSPARASGTAQAGEMAAPAVLADLAPSWESLDDEPELLVRGAEETVSGSGRAGSAETRATGAVEAEEEAESGRDRARVAGEAGSTRSAGHSAGIQPAIARDTLGREALDLDDDLEGSVGSDLGAIDEDEDDLALGVEPDDLRELDELDDLEEPDEQDEQDEQVEAREPRAEHDLGVPEAQAAASPVPAPSWEQADLFEDDNEPVDAYGTPVKLVETLRGTDATTASVAPQAATTEVSASDATSAAAAQRAALRGEMRSAQAALMEAQVSLEEALPPSGERAAVERVAGAAPQALSVDPVSVAVDAGSASEPGEDDSESAGKARSSEPAGVAHWVPSPERPSHRSRVAVEIGFEPEAEPVPEPEPDAEKARRVIPDFEDGLSAPEGEYVPGDESPSDVEGFRESEPTVATAPIAERARDAEPAPESDPAPRGEARAQGADLAPAPAHAELTPSLFSEAQPAPAAAPAKKRSVPKSKRASAASGEPVRVLEPHAVEPGRTIKPAARGDDRRQLLTEAGCLFVERGRVAVSMLQREYALDFDDACRVLDELQDLGLIGPYLGGQRRDILLTREQWLEKLSSP